MILLYTTHSSKVEAEKVTELLLKEKAIACVNYFPVEACLIWQGEKTAESEIVALIKLVMLSGKKQNKSFLKTTHTRFLV